MWENELSLFELKKIYLDLENEWQRRIEIARNHKKLNENTKEDDIVLQTGILELCNIEQSLALCNDYEHGVDPNDLNYNA